MTPAERLLAAADLLDKRAGEATSGPWAADFVTEIDPDGAFDLAHVLAPNDDPSDGYAGIAVAASILRPDATYIATMHPEVGKHLVEWLREEAAEAAIYRGPKPEHLFRFALAIADLLLAGES